MQTEAVLNKESDTDKPAIAPEKDPKLLGVSLPLTATIEAAIQVKNAWASALSAVLAAAKAKTSAAKSKAEATAATNGSSEINA